MIVPLSELEALRAGSRATASLVKVQGVTRKAKGLRPVSGQLSVVSRGFAGFQRLERVPQRGTIEQFEPLERVLRKQNDRTFTLIPDPRPRPRRRSWRDYATLWTCPPPAGRITLSGTIASQNGAAPEAGGSTRRSASGATTFSSMQRRPAGLWTPPRSKARPHGHTINAATMRLCRIDPPAVAHCGRSRSLVHSAG